MRPLETSLDRTLPLLRDPALRRRFMVIDEPLSGNLRFGRMLEVLDKLAEETALDYVRRFQADARVVTAAIDRILVHDPADVTRDIIMQARINHIGRTSLEVGIRVTQPGQPGSHIASCYFTMAARAADGSPARALPPLEYVDEMERFRAQDAIRRRNHYAGEQEAATRPPRHEEFELLARLHAAQEEPGFSGLLARDLRTNSWARMYPDQENVPKKIFGGYLVHRAYELAAINAEEVAPHRPVIVAVNRINFLNAVRLGDKLHFTSRVVYTGRTSICVEVNIERISRDRTTKALSNTCVFTFANVDDQLVPQPVPPIHPTAYDEDARFIAAHRRAEAHRAQRGRQADSNAFAVV